MPLSKQEVNGSLPSRASRRKAKNRKQGTPRHHTKRFRALFAFDPNAFGGRGANVIVGHSPPVYARSLASVGGPTRRAMKKRQRVDMNRLSASAMLPQWMQAGLAAFNKIAQSLAEKHEAAQRVKRESKHK